MADDMNLGYEIWNDPTAQTASDCGRTYKLAGLKTFKVFRDFAKDMSGWENIYTSEKCKCFIKNAPPGPGEGLNIYKVVVDFPNSTPQTVYDALHDAEFRKTWDTSMTLGYNVCQLDARNDVGYYGCNFPWPLAKREFCNQRMWMEFTNGEFIIMNHSVLHAKCPPDKNYVRAISYMSGYYIMPSSGGTQMWYISHSDPKGNIPHWALNTGMGKVIPGMMGKLEKNCENYVPWSAENHPAGWVPSWMTPKMDWDGPENQTAATNAPTGSVSLLANPQATEKTSMEAVAEEDDPDAKLAQEKQVAQPSAASNGHKTVELQKQLNDLKRELFLANERGGEISLAPVAPRQNDPVAVQQFRAIMYDACNFVDRQFLQEGKVPSLHEYLGRLRTVLEGMRKFDA